MLLKLGFPHLLHLGDKEEKIFFVHGVSGACGICMKPFVNKK